MESSSFCSRFGFTQSLAQEVASAGITVNAICPSAVETERLDHLGFQPDGTVDLHQRGMRIKEIGAAEYITGQSINVTGGGVMH